MRRTEQILCFSYILICFFPFRCSHCTSEFGTRRAMAVIAESNPPLGTGCADPSNSKSLTFYWTCQYFIVNCSGTRYSRCATHTQVNALHRRKQSSPGTGCEDPSNSKSVSFTGRASISSSIVREHDILGAQPTHTVRI
jgi:hypothetical protein